MEIIKKDFYEVGELVADDIYRQKIEALRQSMSDYEAAGAAPNVDLYSGAMWRMLGVPQDRLLLLFTVARMAGWIAHAIEQVQSRILIRPRLKYVGPEQGVR